MAINFLALSSTIQLTSSAMLTTGADIFSPAGVRQSTPTSATIITTPPTFAGIVSATPHTNGSFNIVWPAATGPNAPITFQVYAALGSVSAASLFVPSNLVDIGESGTTFLRIWTLGDRVTYFVNGLTYTFGVRARDGVQNQNTNLAIATATAIGSGNITAVLQTLATDLAATEVLLAADHVNFQGDHTNFQADHIDFQADHANFVADDAAFDADHATFVADHADFQADHANFVADHAAFVADDAAFDADHANFVADHAAFVAEIDALDAVSSSIIASLAPAKLTVTVKSQQKLSVTIKEQKLSVKIKEGG